MKELYGVGLLVVAFMTSCSPSEGEEVTGPSEHFRLESYVNDCPTSEGRSPLEWYNAVNNYELCNNHPGFIFDFYSDVEGLNDKPSRAAVAGLIENTRSVFTADAMMKTQSFKESSWVSSRTRENANLAPFSFYCFRVKISRPNLPYWCETPEQFDVSLQDNDGKTSKFNLVEDTMLHASNLLDDDMEQYIASDNFDPMRSSELTELWEEAIKLAGSACIHTSKSCH